MGFRKHKNENFDDLVHRIDLDDLETGNPAMIGDKRQFVIVKGSRSSDHKDALEFEENKKRKQKGNDADFSFDTNERQLARKLSKVIVSAYVDGGDETDPDIIEFSDISTMPKVDRENMQYRMTELLTDVTDLAIFINDQVVKDSNFLVSQGQTLSALLSSERGTQPQSNEAPAKTETVQNAVV